MKAFIVGAGRLGSALAYRLPSIGVEVDGSWSRTPESAKSAEKATGRPCSSGSFPSSVSKADIVFITVPDDQVARVCDALTAEGLIKESQGIIHTSGCLDLTPLESARQIGASVASMHPLASFATGSTQNNCFEGSLALLDGEEELVQLLARIAQKLGMNPATLDSNQVSGPTRRALYHAAAVMAAGGVVSTLDLAVKTAIAAGLDSREALTGLLNLTRCALNNLEREKDTRNALTGPVARGDMQVVQQHITAIEDLSLDPHGLYRTLSAHAETIVASSKTTSAE